MADGSLIPSVEPSFGAPDPVAAFPATVIETPQPSLGAPYLLGPVGSEVVDTAPYTLHGEGGGGGAQRMFLMRGWRPLHIPPDYETWIAESWPNILNPSGETIQNITVQGMWVLE